jgi:hypothetical protein
VRCFGKRKEFFQRNNIVEFVPLTVDVKMVATSYVAISHPDSLSSSKAGVDPVTSLK